MTFPRPTYSIDPKEFSYFLLKKNNGDWIPYTKHQYFVEHYEGDESQIGIARLTRADVEEYNFLVPPIDWTFWRDKDGNAFVDELNALAYISQAVQKVKV